MSQNITGLTALTGGASGALDSIDGGLLSDGDRAEVRTSSGIYHYHLNATSGASEDSPYVISPDSNAGTKRWILVHQEQPFSHVNVTTTAGQSIPDSTSTEVIFDTEDYDVLNEFNTTTGRFTATHSGYYTIKANVLFDNVSWLLRDYVRIDIYKDGVVYRYGKPTRIQVDITTLPGASIATSLYLSSSSYVSIYAIHDQGSTINLNTAAAYTYLSIDRIA